MIASVDASQIQEPSVQHPDLTRSLLRAICEVRYHAFIIQCKVSRRQRHPTLGYLLKDAQTLRTFEHI